MRAPSVVLRAAAVLGVMAALAGCASGERRQTVSVSADVDPSQPTSTATASTTAAPAPSAATSACTAKAMQVLEDIAQRVYREGVTSERTATARYFITTSAALREAVERGDSQAARAAAQALITEGRITNLRISRDTGQSSVSPGSLNGQLLADVGAPALAPITGTLSGPGGALMASYLTSVWSDSGFLMETDGITEGVVVLRGQARDVAGALTLPRGSLAVAGTIRLHGVEYRYTSFPVAAYPSGTLRVYLLRSTSSLASLCGQTDQDTLVNTLRRVASLIYQSERGTHALAQVRRVQSDAALLNAVARRDPAATREAIDNLLHEHVVRLRVSAEGRLLADVGGPYVLAPVSAPLRLGGRQIGSFVLSVQDDEGYKRLTGRLAGLRVLMYMGSQLVKNSLGPSPGTPPATGTYSYGGQQFRVFTLHAEAFPSGPLRIVVLVPLPYS